MRCPTTAIGFIFFKNDISYSGEPQHQLQPAGILSSPCAVHNSRCGVPTPRERPDYGIMEVQCQDRTCTKPPPRERKKRPALAYLQCTQLLMAALQLTGVLPHRLLYINNNHVAAEPLLLAGREFLHLLVPFVRCDHRTTITEERTPHVLARRAVTPNRPHTAGVRRPYDCCSPRMLKLRPIKCNDAADNRSRPGKCPSEWRSSTRAPPRAKRGL